MELYARSGETISERYGRIGGFTSGFDYLRIALAVCVVFNHAIFVTDQYAWVALWGTWWRAAYGQIMPAFFALSGFLVAASLERRPTVSHFMTMRAIRLIPALSVELALSMLIIGVLFTDLPLRTYFSSGMFWSYFGNLVGIIQFNLPGVFHHNPSAQVNGSLWTLPFELECYIALALLYLSGFIQHRRRLVCGLLAIFALVGAWIALRYQPSWEAGPLPGRYFVLAFLVGVAFQIWRDKIRLNGWVCLAAVALSSLLVMRVDTGLLAIVPITYATIYLGMLHPKRIPIVLSGDYSYGLYLFAFPIQQAEVALFPAYAWWGYNAAFALVLGSAYAAFSWWCIEKPILARKKVIAAAVEALWMQLVAIGQGPARASDREGARADRRPVGQAAPLSALLPTPEESGIHQAGRR
jgi:peptidoglycan/LPS O-acetylase OafA/YrhL